MSFGTAASDETHGQYVAVFAHTNGAEIEIRSRLSPVFETLDPTDMDEAYADAVALLDGSADFTFAVGQKTYPTTESYTP